MRESGILMPVASLPGPCGIGTLGAPAYRFVDFLKRAGQRVWQVLPIGPTGLGNSPYLSASGFAGNSDLIDFPLLVQDGLLDREDLSVFVGTPEQKVLYDPLNETRTDLLKKAFRRFRGWEEERYHHFYEENGWWLEDHAQFMAIKKQMQGAPFYEWPAGLRDRDSAALADIYPEVRDEIAYHKFVQYIFWRQWHALRNYAKQKGIEILGDLPFYVSGDSADVWSHPELFLLDAGGKPAQLAGCPPDAFSETGQLWGNPIYNWEAHRGQNYSWWIARIRHALRVYHRLRLDHFRGFDSYWSIPAQAQSAKEGRWLCGPGMAFFEALYAALGRDIPLVAEDLGLLFDSVHTLRCRAGLPGMAVLQFAFDPAEESAYLPHNHRFNSVAYIGTHDNDTAAGWLKSAPRAHVRYAVSYLKLTRQEGYVNGLIRAVLSSVAQLAIVPMQDYLGLGSEARINVPGTVGDNWAWRLEEKKLTAALARRIGEQCALYGRSEAEGR